jgi:hypothetical protein
VIRSNEARTAGPPRLPPTRPDQYLRPARTVDRPYEVEHEPDLDNGAATEQSRAARPTHTTRAESPAITAAVSRLTVERELGRALEAS